MVVFLWQKKKNYKNDKVGPLLEKGLSSRGFPGGSDGKASACNARDLDLCPGNPGKSPGEGNGSPFQYSCLENSRKIIHFNFI